MRNVIKYIAAGILSTVVSTSAFADDSLNISNSSVNGFSGTFQADAHTIKFNSTLESQTLVSFTVNINGEAREANFDLQNSQLTLIGGNQQLTPAGKTEAANAVKVMVPEATVSQYHTGL